MDALVCVEPGELEFEQRPAPRRSRSRRWSGRAASASAAPTITSSRASIRSCNYPRVMGHELAVEVVEAPRRRRLSRPARSVVVNPYLSCGTCIACRDGKPNCCIEIAVLGVHRDGGMAELLALPAGNLIRADGLSARRSAPRSSSSPSAPMRCGAARIAAGDTRAGHRRRPDRPRRRALRRALGRRGHGDRPRRERAAAAHVDRRRDRRHPVDDSARRRRAPCTDGDGFDVVFDATGNRQSMEAGFDFVAHGGRYVLVSVVKDVDHASRTPISTARK